MSEQDTALAVYEGNGAALTTNGHTAALAARERERRDLIKRTAMAPHATDDEFRLFLFVAERLGLDPLARQIYAIHRKNGKNPDGSDRYQMTIQTGIDGYFAIASEVPGFAGIDDVIFDTETAPHPNKATVTAYKLVDGQRVPFTASVRWNEYAQRKPVWINGKPAKDAEGNPITELTGMWVTAPYNQLGKCAIAKVLRMVAPKRLGGVYTDDEMGQADNPPEVYAAAALADPTPAPKALPAAAPTRPATATAAKPAPAPVKVTPAPAEPVHTQPAHDNDTRAKFAELRERARAAGIRNDDDWEIVCEQHAGTADPLRMLPPGKRNLVRYVADLEAQKAAAEAKLTHAGDATAADFPESDPANPASDVPGALDMRELPVPAVRP